MASKASSYPGVTMLEGPGGEVTQSKRELPEEPQLLESSQTGHQPCEGVSLQIFQAQP